MELSFHINLLERKSSGQPRFRTSQAAACASTFGSSGVSEFASS
jgi:hypothetical protein